MRERLHPIAGLLLGATLCLSACGFHPRGEIHLPAALGQLTVEDADPYSSLARDVRAALGRAGAVVKDEAGAGTARVHIALDQAITEPLSISGTARVQEYLVRYRVELEVFDAGGKQLLEKTPIELSREYSFDATQALGSASEQELIRNELRKEMIQQVLRRIESIR